MGDRDRIPLAPIVRRSILLCDAAECATSGRPGEDSLHADSSMENPMQHFHAGNLDKIQDAPPNAWATVHANDFVTFSELVRRGFHLVDMRGEIWTMRRAG